MKKNKVIIPILIFFICVGYYFYRSYGVNAIGFSQGNITAKNSNDASIEKQKGKSGKNSDKASNNSKNNLIGVGATSALTMTQVSDNGFSFAIQADSHLDQNTNTDLYKQTLQNIVSEKPSFLVDLGDTFMSEKFAKTQQEVEQRYVEAKSYFTAFSR